MNDAERDAMLKDMAANRGCKLVKSRRRKPGTGDYGRYGLKDAGSEREVFGFSAQGLLTASAEEIEAFLRKGALANWKSSLAAAAGPTPANDERVPIRKASTASANAGKRQRKGDKEDAQPEPRAKPRLRVVGAASTPSPLPAPPPPPPPPAPRAILRIREARPADAESLKALLGDHGDHNSKALGARIAVLRKQGAPPVVAEEGGRLLGIVAFHALPLVQEDAPLGRLTLLLVAPAARRRGIGRALAKEAAARLADLGCTRVEALAEIELAAAPDFFRRLGWSRNAYRYSTERPPP